MKHAVLRFSREIAVFLGLLFIIFPQDAAFAAGGTVVSVSTPVSAVKTGQQFTVEILVEPGSAIAGMQFDLSFNPALVAADYVVEGNLFNRNGAGSYFSPGHINNRAGTVSDVFGVIMDSGRTASAAGTFAVIHMRATGADGSSALALSNVIVGNAAGQAVPVTTCAGMIQISALPAAAAPAISLNADFTWEELQTVVQSAGGGCYCGGAPCRELIFYNGGSTYTVFCAGEYGSSVKIGSISFIESEHIDIPLNAGWNLVSIPYHVEPEKRTPHDLLSGIIDNLNIVWSFDACGKGWSNYATSGPPGSINEISDGRGYWLLMNRAGTLTLEGHAVLSPPLEYPVCAGWNLIGFSGNQPTPAADYLSGVRYSVVYGFRNGAYHLVRSTDMMEPGRGYWIAIVEPGTIRG